MTPPHTHTHQKIQLQHPGTFTGNITEETWGLFSIIETSQFFNNVQSIYLRHGLRKVKKFTGNN